MPGWLSLARQAIRVKALQPRTPVTRGGSPSSLDPLSATTRNLPFGTTHPGRGTWNELTFNCSPILRNTTPLELFLPVNAPNLVNPLSRSARQRCVRGMETRIRLSASKFRRKPRQSSYGFRVCCRIFGASIAINSSPRISLGTFPRISSRNCNVQSRR